MTRKNDINVKTNIGSRTVNIRKYTQKPHLSIASKHRKPKVDKMVGKKKAIMILKSKLRLNRIQEEAPSSQQQLSTSPGSSALVNYSPNNGPATAVEKGGLNSKGKGRADPGLLIMQESTSHDFPMYELNHQEDPISDQQQSMQASMSSHVQYPPPPNMSQDQPPGSFFQGPTDNVEINGGTLNHIHGHHINFTIQVNQPRDDTPHQQPHTPPLSIPSQTGNQNIPSPSKQDIHPCEIATPEQEMAMPEQGSSTSTTMYAPENGNKIYERHLELMQRGFPLWIPEPDRNLPMPYRHKGINIGDVGIITPTGGFSFLFNICLQHDNPINPQRLPDGFAPIYSPGEFVDVRECSELKPESYLASTAIEKIQNDPRLPGLSFATSAAEGAILTLPDGAISRDIENILDFRAYAAANIESWYRYVNVVRGREVKNGEIRLVIGCDKATSWGMAAVANMTQRKTHYLNYRPVSEDEVNAAPIPLYKWDYTGLAQARVGPDLAEVEDLKRNDHSGLAVGGKYWNQCLFIRTLNLTLSEESFAVINEELESAFILKMQQFQNKRGSSGSINENPPDTGVQTDNAGQHFGTSSATQRVSTKVTLESTPENLAVNDVTRERATMSKSPSAPKSHPADVLNKVLLQKVPNSRVVITQDEDWCSVISEDDELMPSPSEITKRVLGSHYVREEDGVVFLEPKKERRSILRHHQISSSQFITDVPVFPSQDRGGDGGISAQNSLTDHRNVYPEFNTGYSQTSDGSFSTSNNSTIDGSETQFQPFANVSTLHHSTNPIHRNSTSTHPTPTIYDSINSSSSNFMKRQHFSVFAPYIPPGNQNWENPPHQGRPMLPPILSSTVVTTPSDNWPTINAQNNSRLPGGASAVESSQNRDDQRQYNYGLDDTRKQSDSPEPSL